MTTSFTVFRKFNYNIWNYILKEWFREKVLFKAVKEKERKVFEMLFLWKLRSQKCFMKKILT